jgi:hypothetical protein
MIPSHFVHYVAINRCGDADRHNRTQIKSDSSEPLFYFTPPVYAYEVSALDVPFAFRA